MDKQIDCIKTLKNRIIQMGKKIFDLELEIIRTRAELEIEKRYTHCLEKVIEEMKGE